MPEKPSEQSRIPTSKIQRASRFVSTGAKVGRNYVKHYARKVSGTADKSQLDADNAGDIYDSLSELKGSALKLAQMLAMDQALLPKAYQDQFAMGQYNAPPLSYPLVVKTFQNYLGQRPTDIFDEFSKSAVNAASIGQVHKATKNGKTYAVKVQYPGVAESVKSDIRIVKPFAMRLLNLNAADLDPYIAEVESKLLEETDYELELVRSKFTSRQCDHIDGLHFANYYPELSSRRILTMDWLDGHHVDQYIKQNPPIELRNKIGQALWDFYDYQIHGLKQVHADPHPGNFIIQSDGRCAVIDFGCIKEIPSDFYSDYFQLMELDTLADTPRLDRILTRLGFLFTDDSDRERQTFRQIFLDLIKLLGRPFHSDSFDFSDPAYFNEIYTMSDRLSEMKELRESKKGRGSKHTLYINRTYFGLYNLLHQLGATVDTQRNLNPSAESQASAASEVF